MAAGNIGCCHTHTQVRHVTLLILTPTPAFFLSYSYVCVHVGLVVVITLAVSVHWLALTRGSVRAHGYVMDKSASAMDKTRATFSQLITSLIGARLVSRPPLLRLLAPTPVAAASAASEPVRHRCRERRRSEQVYSHLSMT